MPNLLTVCLSFAGLIAVIAFIKEHRLRLALQRLVTRLLKYRRFDVQDHRPSGYSTHDSDGLSE